MIGYITGKILDKNDRSAIVDVSGVGYLVFMPNSFLNSHGLGEEISTWTHLVVKEDVLDLYGFKTKKDLGLFKLLISVSGVGPKSALSVLSLSSTETLENAISAGDTSYLTKVSGIGKKSAEKIIIELQDKLGTLDQDGLSSTKTNNDVIDALLSLGYSMADIRTTLPKLTEDTSIDIKIKEALKLLNTNR